MIFTRFPPASTIGSPWNLAPLGFVLAASVLPVSATPPPAPFGAVPTERQIAWHRREAYAFVHFTINTFTDKEWGYGDESPALFAPTAFDAAQIARAARDAGLSGIVLTAKHHDGFSLWPSRHSEHTIARSPFRDGHGDVVREIADAARAEGLAFGVYLSPWDRNRADYGQPSYVDYYRAQLRELLTGYGPLFEIWFDGANGGDGWYGGAREKREIDRRTYYGWEETWRMVREVQPNAAIFSDAGPDCRWVGNEEGFAAVDCRATINAAGFSPGNADIARLPNGDRHGTHWIPAEVDVSIRPGWFYHASEDDKVKTPERLWEIYLHSVGRGANLILNLAPDRRGQIPERDVASLRAFGQRRAATFRVDLARDARLRVSATRGDDPAFTASHLTDGDVETYWSTDDTVTTAEVVLDLPEARTFDLIRLREQIRLGERIDDAAVDVWDETAASWREVARCRTIGAGRLLPLDAPVTTRRVRLRILAASACPALSEFGLFLQAKS